jgi:hypothetical protein
MPATFAELQAKGATTTAWELCETLEDYATSGAAIAPHVVIELIRCVSLHDGDRAALMDSAKKGVARQKKWKSRDEYQQVVNHLSGQ